MVSVVKSGTAIRYAIEPGVGGQPMTAHSVSVTVTLAGLETYNSSIAYADAQANGIVIPGSALVVAERRAFAILTYEFLDEQGAVISLVADEVVVESSNLLVPGENSFASYQDLILASFDMTDLAAFRDASREEQIAALITAYYNVGSMGVVFFHTFLADPTFLSPQELFQITSTRALSADAINALKPNIRTQLLRSQLAEADSILGGNPIERQRIMGLLSHAAGESTHFYRTSKPLELPICRRAAVELRGILNYALRISR